MTQQDKLINVVIEAAAREKRAAQAFRDASTEDQIARQESMRAWTALREYQDELVAAAAKERSDLPSEHT